MTDELVKSFPREMDVAFTAGMEEKLDEIEEGTANWQAVLHDFYTGFKEDLAKAEVTMRDVKRQEIATELSCEKCGKPMVIKWGRMGEFLRLLRLPRVPEHHELPPRGRRLDRAHQGGGDHHRREVPDLRLARWW